MNLNETEMDFLLSTVTNSVWPHQSLRPCHWDTGRTCRWAIAWGPPGGTLPLWPASRSHCWTVVRESVCRIWHSSSKTWRRKNADSYLAVCEIWCQVACVSGGYFLTDAEWPWAEAVLIFRNLTGKLCLICCETSLGRIECLMADGEIVQISPWALGHARVEGKWAAGNGIHAGKTWRMEGWASQFGLNTESSGSQIVPLAGPKIQNTNNFSVIFHFKMEPHKTQTRVWVSQPSTLGFTPPIRGSGRGQCRVI